MNNPAASLHFSNPIFNALILSPPQAALLLPSALGGYKLLLGKDISHYDLTAVDEDFDGSGIDAGFKTLVGSLGYFRAVVACSKARVKSLRPVWLRSMNQRRVLAS